MGTNRTKIDWAYKLAASTLNRFAVIDDPVLIRHLSATLRRTYKRGHKNGWYARGSLKADMGY